MGELGNKYVIRPQFSHLPLNKQDKGRFDHRVNPRRVGPAAAGLERRNGHLYPALV